MPRTTSSDGGTSAGHQTRQHPESDATRDHGRGADQQERGLEGTGFRQLLLGLTLLHRLRAEAVGVGPAATGRGGGAAGVATAGGAPAARVAARGRATVTGTALVAGAALLTGTTLLATTNGSGTTLLATTNRGSTTLLATTNRGSTTLLATANGSSTTLVGTTLLTATNGSGATLLATTDRGSTTLLATTNGSGTTLLATTDRGSTTLLATTNGGGTTLLTATNGSGTTLVGATVHAARVAASIDATRVSVIADTETGVYGHTHTCGLCDARDGQRRAGGDHRARRDPRHANACLLGHLLATPSSRFVEVQRPGQRPRGGYIWSAPGHTRPRNTHATGSFPIFHIRVKAAARAMTGFTPDVPGMGIQL
ncbi:hypothetical protein ACIO1C_06070 [Streptomyces sp. NPDC087420]|uniref:hypothetical protein n=1 Tax=Streptomyces sp. NPDC087420 TaxID=3365785 RepID=UPI003838B268